RGRGAALRRRRHPRSYPFAIGVDGRRERRKPDPPLTFPAFTQQSSLTRRSEATAARQQLEEDFVLRRRPRSPWVGGVSDRARSAFPRRLRVLARVLPSAERCGTAAPSAIRTSSRGAAPERC